MSVREYIVCREVVLTERVFVNTAVLTPAQIALLDDEAGADEVSRATVELLDEVRWGRTDIEYGDSDEPHVTFDLFGEA